MAAKKIREKILRGTSDANIPFDELRGVLNHLGFSDLAGPKGLVLFFYKSADW